MIHYHGTPLTPRSELLKLAGKHFCVPLSDPRDGDWCLANGQSVMIDNGAFSAFTRGKPVIDWGPYYAWLEPRLGHPHWAVIPDVIDGDAAAQINLLAQWPFDRFLSAPVWHMGLPIDYLLKLAEGWSRICFGSTSQYWQVGSPLWARRCDEAFNQLEKRGLRPWIHMLRGMSLAGDQWPFASVDSVNVARNFKDEGVCPERMARRLDAIQCPIRWTIAAEQQDMLQVVK